MNSENKIKALHSAQFLKADLMELINMENRSEYLLILQMVEQVNKIADNLKFICGE